MTDVVTAAGTLAHVYTGGKYEPEFLAKLDVRSYKMWELTSPQFFSVVRYNSACSQAGSRIDRFITSFMFLVLYFVCVCFN